MRAVPSSAHAQEELVNTDESRMPRGARARVTFLRGGWLFLCRSASLPFSFVLISALRVAWACLHPRSGNTEPVRFIYTSRRPLHPKVISVLMASSNNGFRMNISRFLMNSNFLGYLELRSLHQYFATEKTGYYKHFAVLCDCGLEWNSFRMKCSRKRRVNSKFRSKWNCSINESYGLWQR